MAGAELWGTGVLALEVRGETPAGRRGAASRRRSVALALLLAAFVSGAGAALGLLKQPNPQRHIEQLALAAATAVDVARAAEGRARAAEARARELENALRAAQSRIDALSAFGAAEEMRDYQEAQRLGIAKVIKDSTALWGDQRKHVLAALVREARRNGLDPVLVAAVIQVESSFDPFAVSEVGARGLMQLMPPTAQWLLQNDRDSSTDPKLRPSHLFNPVLNIELGTAYLAKLLGQFDGDLRQALVAYNAGPRVARSLTRGSKAWQRLQAYPRSVLAAYRSLLVVPATIPVRGA